MARTWPGAIAQQPVAQLPWGHITVLMTKLDTPSELDFYAAQAVRNGWSRAIPDRFIRQGLHLTQGAAANNFAATVPDGRDHRVPHRGPPQQGRRPAGPRRRQRPDGRHLVLHARPEGAGIGAQ
ncbi:DUF1016 N-terminal domain-containing protein [Streptomyces sp. NPDC058473]|uniref:DUF1016 N-terminal domain-containing protein n=1 Tax=Streptomyces sp. NPDC058473 TaxID=3346517 RepID=UPI0036525E03